MLGVLLSHAPAVKSGICIELELLRTDHSDNSTTELKAAASYTSWSSGKPLRRQSMTERTGLLPFWKNYDRKLYLKAAILADELGYDSFWIPEAWGYEIFSLLTEIAVHTKQIKIGTGIVNCFSRSPGLMAMNAATVDEISDGRLILGMGTSGKHNAVRTHFMYAFACHVLWRSITKVMRATMGILLGFSQRPTHRSSRWPLTGTN